jgi:hypothetical protein
LVVTTSIRSGGTPTTGKYADLAAASQAKEKRRDDGANRAGQIEMFWQSVHACFVHIVNGCDFFANGLLNGHLDFANLSPPRPARL